MSHSPSLRVEIKPSLLLAAALSVAHLLALAAAAIVLAGLPLALVAAGIVLSGALTTADALLRTARSARALELHADGRCAWRDGAGCWREGVLHRQHFVTPALIVVVMQDAARQRKRIVLLADSADGESLRRLRGRLRWPTEETTDTGKTLWND